MLLLFYVKSSKQNHFFHRIKQSVQFCKILRVRHTFLNLQNRHASTFQEGARCVCFPLTNLIILLVNNIYYNFMLKLKKKKYYF